MAEKVTVLDNGLKVISRNFQDAVSTFLCFYVKVGGNNELHYPKGMAHFVEHTVYKGTDKRSEAEIIDELTLMGAQSNASTSFDITKYYVKIPYYEIEKGLNLLTDCVFHFTYSDKVIEREKTVIAAEIRQYQNNIGSVGFRHLLSILRANNPERSDILGTEERINTITREDITRFKNEFYQPSNIVFVATGKVDHDKLVEFLEKKTPAKAEASQRDSLLPFRPCVFTEQNTFQIYREMKQARLLWGSYIPNLESKDYYTGLVISKLLGGGRYSRLFKKIRTEKGLVYSVNTRVMANHDESYLLGGLECHQSKMEEVKTDILFEMERLREEAITENQLSMIKNVMIANSLMAQDSHNGLNSTIAEKYMFGIENDYERYKEIIMDIDSRDVQEYCKKYLTNDNLVFLEMLPYQEE